MRFFIALEIPEISKDELEAIQQNLKKVIPQLRLTNPAKLHLTIAFVGEQPPELKKRLTEVIEKAVIGISPFKVTPAYIDGFPQLHHPRIIWVGIKGDIDKLFILRERIKDQLADLLVEADERRYVPHIALAKISNFNLMSKQESELQKIPLDKFSPIQVNSIKLFESIPGHGFHHHNTLAEAKLE